MEKSEITTTTFDIKAIIEYVKRKGFITWKDIEKDFGCSNQFAQTHILDLLEQVSILTIKDDDWEMIEGNLMIRKYKLTERGKTLKQDFGPITIGIKTLPVFSGMLLEIINALTVIAQAQGMEFPEFIETVASNPAKLKQIVDSKRVAILSEYGPEELRKLASELKAFYKH